MRTYNREFRAEDVNGRPIAGAHVTLWNAQTGGSQITTGIQDLAGVTIAGGLLICDAWGFAPGFQDTLDRPDVWAIGSDTGVIDNVDRVHLEPDIAGIGQIGGPAGPLDGSGLIPSAQIPGGGGGGGVSIGGDLGGTNPSPQVIGTHLASPLPLAQGGTAAATASAARTSLGLGGAAILSVGATAGTVAAGDDSRITGAAQKASNLSDLASAATARTNLGVPATSRLITAGTGLTGGGDLSADRTLTVAYGTSGTTAAVGNDARLSDARTPTAHATSHGSAGSDPVTPASIGAATDHGYSPADYGLLAWNGDPGYLAGSLAVPAGIVHMLKIKIPKAMPINNIVIYIAGTITLTAGQNFAALFDTSGTRLGITADQSSNWASAGSKSCALTATYNAPSAGFAYAALLFNGSGPPNMGRFGQSTIYNNASIGSLMRFAQFGSGLTAMPASITMGSVVTDATAAFWAGVS